MRNPGNNLHQLITEYGQLASGGGLTGSARGQRFNGLIAEMLRYWDIDARESVRSAGEIDVAFAVEGVRFVLEAKWEKKKADTGHLAKLQKRVRQRLAGTYGIFLSMSGYSREALLDLADGERLEVLLLERDHFEAMLAGLVPPIELLTLIRDHAAYYGRPHTTLLDLIGQKKPVPTLNFGHAIGFTRPLVRQAYPGVQPEVIVSVPDSNQLGIACVAPERLLVTIASGIAEIDLATRTARWAAPIVGCHRNPAVDENGAILFARQYGVGRFCDGRVTVVAGGLETNSTLFTHASGDVWALCADPTSPTMDAWTVRLGESVADQQIHPLGAEHRSAVGAAWISPTRLATIGSAALTTAYSGPTTSHRPTQSNPMGIARLSDTTVATSGEAVTIVATDTATGEAQQLADLDLRPSVTELAVDPHAESLYIASYYDDGSTSMAIAIVRLNLPVTTASGTTIGGSGEVMYRPAVQSEPSRSVDHGGQREGIRAGMTGNGTSQLPEGGSGSRPAPPTDDTVSPFGVHLSASSTPATVRSLMGEISFDGQWITITKNGVGQVNKGQRRIHLSQVTGINIKPASRMNHGFIQLTVTGYKPAPVAKWGAMAGRPPFDDPDSISFARGKNEDIAALARQIEQAITAARHHENP